jgi:hypothetical protein
MNIKLKVHFQYALYSVLKLRYYILKISILIIYSQKGAFIL